MWKVSRDFALQRVTAKFAICSKTLDHPCIATLPLYRSSPTPLVAGCQKQGCPRADRTEFFVFHAIAVDTHVVAHPKAHVCRTAPVQGSWGSRRGLASVKGKLETRGFVGEPCTLFTGCRTSDKDAVYCSFHLIAWIGGQRMRPLDVPHPVPVGVLTTPLLLALAPASTHAVG